MNISERLRESGLVVICCPASEPALQSSSNRSSGSDSGSYSLISSDPITTSLFPTTLSSPLYLFPPSCPTRSHSC